MVNESYDIYGPKSISVRNSFQMGKANKLNVKDDTRPNIFMIYADITVVKSVVKQDG